MTKLLILDKDGTLVRPKSGGDWVQHPEDQELIPGVAEAIQRYAADGWAMVIASNQGGVAAGHKTLGEAIKELGHCLQLIEDATGNTAVDVGYLCPDSGNTCYEVNWAMDDECSRVLDFGEVHTHGLTKHLVGTFRKPSPGMLKAAQIFGLYSTWDSALFVGDRPEDQQAAANAGVGFMWADDWLIAPIPLV